MVQLDKKYSKSRRSYKFCQFALLMSVVLAAAFVIPALIMQEVGTLRNVFFGLGAFFLFSSVILFFIYFKFLRSSWYEKYQQLERIGHFETFIKKNEPPIFELPFVLSNDNEENQKLFANQLSDFTTKSLGEGTLYYTLGANMFNRLKSSVDAFYFVAPSTKNSFDYFGSKKVLANYAKSIEAEIQKEGIATEFINCLIVFVHDVLEPEEIIFYQNNMGFVRSSNNTHGGGLYSNRLYSYIGLEKATNQLHMFFALKTDMGHCVNLLNLVDDTLLNENPTPQVETEMKVSEMQNEDIALQ